jgi:hypothetical protein
MDGRSIKASGGSPSKKSSLAKPGLFIENFVLGAEVFCPGQKLKMGRKGLLRDEDFGLQLGYSK